MLLLILTESFPESFAVLRDPNLNTKAHANANLFYRRRG